MGIPLTVDDSGRTSASARPVVTGAASVAQQPPPIWGATRQKAEPERVRAAAQQLDRFIKSSARNLEFRVDEKSGEVVVSVRDSSTGEVIRQIPNEETLRIAERLADQAHASSVVLDVSA